MNKESLHRLIQSFDYEDTVTHYAALSAEEGTQQIQQTMEQLLTAEHTVTTAEWPGQFLDDASVALWEAHGRIEPVFYLWEQYYDTKVTYHTTDGEEDALPLKSDFPYALARVTVLADEDEMHNIARMTVAFLTRKEPEAAERMERILIYARRLHDEGEPHLGRQIVQFLLNAEPDLATKYPDCKYWIDLFFTEPQD